MKARRPQVVPLAPMALRIFEDAIARRREEGDKGGVLGSRYLNRETLARHSLSQALRRIIAGLEPKGPDAEAIEALQAEPPTPHDFRRTVATGLAALGILREDRLAVLAHLQSDVHGAFTTSTRGCERSAPPLRLGSVTWQPPWATTASLCPSHGGRLPVVDLRRPLSVARQIGKTPRPCWTDAHVGLRLAISGRFSMP